MVCENVCGNQNVTAVKGRYQEWIYTNISALLDIDVQYAQLQNSKSKFEVL